MSEDKFSPVCSGQLNEVQTNDLNGSSDSTSRCRGRRRRSGSGACGSKVCGAQVVSSRNGAPASTRSPGVTSSTWATELPEFQVFAKPGGAICNLACDYCYYLEKERLYPGVSAFRMSDRLLERYIAQHIAASSGSVIRFSWHGGEPTSLGVDYFRNIVRLQARHAPPDVQIANAIVTNGTLLDAEWCQFLSMAGFAVGLSLDGPRELHDAYRSTKGRKSTHNEVMRGWCLLQEHRVPCDILCVVHDRNVRYPKEVYRFFKQIGATYVGFLPLVERKDDPPGAAAEHSVSAETYGSFLCTIFDEWVRHDIGRIMVQVFDEAARPIRGLEPSLCIFRETCGDIPVLEHNGDLYSCDHFVDDRHLLGNITETSLAELLVSPAQLQFGNDKRDSLPRYCRQCDVRAMCNGGCPKDRFIRTPDGEEGLNYLCAGFKQFFRHSRSTFEQLVPLWQAGATNERLMAAARSEHRRASPRPGRNDPCHCGSGRKYKQCCLVKHL